MYTEPTFPGLLTLPSNRFAFAAAAAVAASPGNIYNPLWLCGPTGTGKTTLLHAMLRQIQQEKPTLRLLYIQAEDFLRRYLDTIRYPGVSDLREELSGLDVLVVDHLNALAYKHFTQYAVGSLLADLAEKGCQVVLASTLGPDTLKDLARVLTHRCEFSLRMDIVSPTSRERLHITRQMARELGVPLANSMACRIAFAARSPSRIRCLLTHLAARQRLLGSEAGSPSEALDQLLSWEVMA